MENQKLSDVIGAEEEIQWTGKPDPNRLFNSADFLLIPLGLFPVFGSFVLLLMGLGILFDNQGDNSINVAACVVAIIPAVVGYYFTIGRILHKRKKRKRTTYIVTTSRVFVLIEGKNISVSSMPRSNLKEIRRSKNKNGSGTLYLGRPHYAIFFEDTGLDYFTETFGQPYIALRDIREVDTVFKLLTDNA